MKNMREELNKRVIQKPPRGIHSELHELIDKMRKDFGETAVKGVGSFGYYLGLLKKVPISKIYIWLGDIKDSPKLDTPLSRCKVFWWKYRYYEGMKRKTFHD